MSSETKWTEKCTTDRFRSRCTACPGRGVISRILAHTVLGPDYQPGNCPGPKAERRETIIGGVLRFLGDGTRFMGSIADLKFVCAQDPNVVDGEVVQPGLPQEMGPQPPALPPAPPAGEAS